jgi:pimeloyl-ACP methyl ester carboxylesterase
MAIVASLYDDGSERSKRQKQMIEGGFLLLLYFFEEHVMSSSEMLETFRSTHHLCQTIREGHTWSWYTCGVGSQTVVMLPGAGAFGALGAEVMFPVITALEQQYRVIAFGYPFEATTVRELIDGIHKVLAEQHVQQADFLGHSLGSLLTLCYLDTYPQQVDSVVIANFALPSSAHLRSLKRALSLVVRLPAWVTSRVVKSQFRQSLQDYPDDFWRAYLTGKEAESAFQHMTTHYRCMLDFVQHWHISPESFVFWPGRALILESDMERDVTPQERANTQALFVDSSVHVFHHARHLSFVTHTQEFTETVRRFLSGERGT